MIREVSFSLNSLCRCSYLWVPRCCENRRQALRSETWYFSLACLIALRLLTGLIGFSRQSPFNTALSNERSATKRLSLLFSFFQFFKTLRLACAESTIFLPPAIISLFGHSNLTDGLGYGFSLRCMNFNSQRL